MLSLFNLSSAALLIAVGTAMGSSVGVSWSLQNGGLKLQYNHEQKDVILPADWLRERCMSKECVDQESLQPLVDPHDVDRVQIESLKHEGENLHVKFSDQIKATYPVASLLDEISYERHAGIQMQAVKYPEPHLWSHELIMPPVFDYQNLDKYRSQLISNLMVTGLVLLDNVPKRSGFCTEFGATISTVRVTEWGKEFNVRTQPDDKADVLKKDLAYTPLGIGMHTDNPYRDPMPDFQLLHQIEGCTCPEDGPTPCAPKCNVENYFSDGFKVARDLKEEDPEAFKLLTEVPVRWENNGGVPNVGGSLVANYPHIELQQQGGASCGYADCIAAIRFSAKSGGYAPLLDPETSTAFFAAKRKFSKMLADPKYKIAYHMKPGQMVAFDNKRILHGRSYVQSDKPRFVQGCYINRDGLWYQFAKDQKMKSDMGLPAGMHSLATATKQEFENIGKEYKKHVDDKLAETFKKMLRNQQGASLGQPVDLYEHGLQTATRAYRAGESVDIVVMSLFHDMTESLSAKNHGEASAGFLEPYLSPQATWMLRKHEEFQGYYYYHHFGGNRNERLRYKNHKWFQALVDWCEKYDQASFDFQYPTLPLQFFDKMIDEVFSRRAFWWDPKHPKTVAVTGSGNDNGEEVKQQEPVEIVRESL